MILLASLLIAVPVFPDASLAQETATNRDPMHAKYAADLRLMLNTRRADPNLSVLLMTYLSDNPRAAAVVGNAIRPLNLPTRLFEMVGSVLADAQILYLEAGETAAAAAVDEQIALLPETARKAFVELREVLQPKPSSLLMPSAPPATLSGPPPSAPASAPRRSAAPSAASPRGAAPPRSGAGTSRN